MGFLNKLAGYSAVVAAGYEEMFESVRTTLAAPGTFKTDTFVEQGLNLWLKSADGWCNLFPFLAIDATPVALFDIATNNGDTSTNINVPPLDPGTAIEKTDILPLGGATGKIAKGNIDVQGPAGGVITVKLKNIPASGLSAGQYQGFILQRPLGAADATILATVFVLVS